MPEPTADEAWRAGYEAGRRRQPLLGNPYPAGTPQFRIWQSGWREAEGTSRPGDRPPPSRTT